MYFVPLTSPDPVRTEMSPANSQVARITSVNHRVDRGVFQVECPFEIAGSGYLKSIFDHGQKVEKEMSRLREGRRLERQLESITVQGAGQGTIEVDGVITNGQAQVTEVRLRFAQAGQPSPVSIGLTDFQLIDNAVVPVNEQVARINVLSFRATTNARPRMSVTVDSVRPKDAGNSFLARLGGTMVGMAANLFLKPIAIDPAGHEAMLRFGAHLAAGRPSFTFPVARQLQAPTPPAGATATPSEPETPR
ncbi:MAG: hypothetical protein RJA22_774 [Verrucomicrobiota bacterium]